MAGSSEPAFLFLRAKKELLLQQPFSYLCNSASPRERAAKQQQGLSTKSLPPVKRVARASAISL